MASRKSKGMSVQKWRRKTKKKARIDKRLAGLKKSIKYSFLLLFVVSMGVWVLYHLKPKWTMNSLHTLYSYGKNLYYTKGLAIFLNESPLTEKQKIDKVLQRTDGLYGIDISKYQGKINWRKVDSIQSVKPISFCFIRATVGTSRDTQYKKNWKQLKKKKIIKGAYHYYRPNENSTKQAQRFIKEVTLQNDDFPPVLDIENLSTVQSIERLKDGWYNWLLIIEAHYHVKPIIYTGDSFNQKHLQDERFNEYIKWIANYGNHRQSPWASDWRIWQFTKHGSVEGIEGPVDLNFFKGDREELEKLLIKKNRPYKLF